MLSVLARGPDLLTGLRLLGVKPFAFTTWTQSVVVVASARELRLSVGIPSRRISDSVRPEAAPWVLESYLFGHFVISLWVFFVFLLVLLGTQGFFL